MRTVFIQTHHVRIGTQHDVAGRIARDAPYQRVGETVIGAQAVGPAVPQTKQPFRAAAQPQIALTIFKSGIDKGATDEILVAHVFNGPVLIAAQQCRGSADPKAVVAVGEQIFDARASTTLGVCGDIQLLRDDLAATIRQQVQPHRSADPQTLLGERQMSYQCILSARDLENSVAVGCVPRNRAGTANPDGIRVAHQGIYRRGVCGRDQRSPVVAQHAAGGSNPHLAIAALDNGGY